MNLTKLLLPIAVLAPTVAQAQGQGSWGDGFANGLLGLLILPLLISLFLVARLINLRATGTLVFIALSSIVFGGSIYIRGGIGSLLVLLLGPWVVMVALVIGAIAASIRNRNARGE